MGSSYDQETQEKHNLGPIIVSSLHWRLNGYLSLRLNKKIISMVLMEFGIFRCCCQLLKICHQNGGFKISGVINQSESVLLPQRQLYESTWCNNIYSRNRKYEAQNIYKLCHNRNGYQVPNKSNEYFCNQLFEFLTFCRVFLKKKSFLTMTFQNLSSTLTRIQSFESVPFPISNPRLFSIIVVEQMIPLISTWTRSNENIFRIWSK